VGEELPSQERAVWALRSSLVHKTARMPKETPKADDDKNGPRPITKA